jgi:hypothetical protein
MATENLYQFFREKLSKSASAGTNSGIDWGRRRREMVEHLDGLYKTVEEYLAQAIQEGSVSVSYSTKQITEDYIGTYEVREMVLQVGDERVVFSPKGRNIAGVGGRVDLRGPLGERTLVVQGGEWSIIMSRTPTPKLVPLDPDSLLTALRGVMNP